MELLGIALAVFGWVSYREAEEDRERQQRDLQQAVWKVEEERRRVEGEKTRERLNQHRPSGLTCIIDGCNRELTKRGPYKGNDVPYKCTKHGLFRVCRKAGCSNLAKSKWLGKDTASAKRAAAAAIRNTRCAECAPRKVPPSLRAEVLVRDNFTCKWCGRNVREHGVVLHIDHIVPVSRGGPTVKENLQVLCAEDNLAKSNRYSI